MRWGQSLLPRNKRQDKGKVQVVPGEVKVRHEEQFLSLVEEGLQKPAPLQQEGEEEDVVVLKTQLVTEHTLLEGGRTSKIL